MTATAVASKTEGRTQDVLAFLRQNNYPVQYITINPVLSWIVTVHYFGKSYQAHLDEKAGVKPIKDRFRLALLQNAEIELTPQMLRNFFKLGDPHPLVRELFQPGRKFAPTDGSPTREIESIELHEANDLCRIRFMDPRQEPMSLRDFGQLYCDGGLQLVA